MRYESEQDRINEEEVIKQFIKEGEKYKKLGDYDLDFVVYNEEEKLRICYAEVKCTNLHSEKFTTQMISLKKVLKMQQYSRSYPTYLIYRYSDCTMSIEIKELEGRVEWGGRNNPREGAVNDKELMVFIDKSKMKKVE